MEGASCPSCGTARGPGDRFCGTCGADLTAPATPAAPAKIPQRTMLGVVPAAAAPAAAPPAAAPAPAKPAKAAQQTMLGMMSPLLAKPSSETAVTPPVVAAPSATPAQAPTMLGMPKAPPQAGTAQV